MKRGPFFTYTEAEAAKKPGERIVFERHWWLLRDEEKKTKVRRSARGDAG